jgi:membrane protease subunit HflC
MKRKPLTLAVAVVLLVIFGLMLFVYQVRVSEVAVVTFFGKVVHTKAEPGPGLRLPYPIERVYKLDQRIQNFQDTFEQIRLNDQNTILLSVYVGYRISEPGVFFTNFYNGSIPEAEKVLTQIVRNSKGEVGGRHDFSDFISTDPKQMEFAQIEQQILAQVTNTLNALHYGVEIKFLQIQKIGLPESVTQNVFARMNSGRQYYIDQINSQGELDATRIKSTADGTAANLLADAEAQAFIIQGYGESQMMKSLEVLQQNPNLAIFNMQIAAMDQLLKKNTTLVLDLSTSPLQWLQMAEPAKSLTNELTKP